MIRILTTALILTAASVATAGQPIAKFPTYGNTGPYYNPYIKPPVHYTPAIPYAPKIIAQPSYRPTYAKYHLTYGTAIGNGLYCYKGFNHNHWTWSGYNSFYGCKVYWCPATLVYYYWCPIDGCYYPVSYTPYGTYVF